MATSAYPSQPSSCLASRLLPQTRAAPSGACQPMISSRSAAQVRAQLQSSACTTICPCLFTAPPSIPSNPASPANLAHTACAADWLKRMGIKAQAMLSQVGRAPVLEQSHTLRLRQLLVQLPGGQPHVLHDPSSSPGTLPQAAAKVVIQLPSDATGRPAKALLSPHAILLAAHVTTCCTASLPIAALSPHHMPCLLLRTQAPPLPACANILHPATRTATSPATHTS